MKREGEIRCRNPGEIRCQFEGEIRCQFEGEIRGGNPGGKSGVGSSETTLQHQEIHTSWATVRDLLATHQLATIILPTGQNGVLRIRRSATPEPDQRVLYEALGVPTEIIRPVKTWERNQPNSD